jgi:hypothetical protein
MVVEHGLSHCVRKRMLAPTREDVTEVWLKLHNAEGEMGPAFSILWRAGNGYKVLVRKYEGNRSLERHEQMVG